MERSLSRSSRRFFFPRIDDQVDAIAFWATLWRIFNTMDVDHDGTIAVTELNQGLREHVEVRKLLEMEYYTPAGKAGGKAPPVPRAFEEVIAKFDHDNDGKISWQEFAGYFSATQSTS